MSDKNQPIQTLPVLPLKNTVLFPHLLMPLSVGRASSLAAVEAAVRTEEKELVLFTQKDASVEVPGQDDLHPIGTKAIVRKVNRQDDSVELLVLGTERVALIRIESTEPFLRARISSLPLPEDKGAEVEALHGALTELGAKAITLAQPNSPQELGRLLAANDDPLRLSYLLASMFSLDAAKEQALLEAPTRVEAPA